MLLAADIVEVEHCLWDYHTIMSCDGDLVQVGFCPVPSQEVQEQTTLAGISASNTKSMTNEESQGEKPKFGP